MKTDELLKAAVDLFRERGFERLPWMKSGVPGPMWGKGTIYLYFGNKEQIFIRYPGGRNSKE